MTVPASPMSTASRSSLSGRTVLVTGASGFLARHLIESLRQEGAEVHAASRSLTPGLEGGVVRWRADLAGAEAAGEIVRRTSPDVLVHLAGHATAAAGREHVLPTLHHDLATTVNVLVAASEHGVGRVVITGSLNEPIPDGGEPIPSSPYAAAKWASTAYSRMFHALYGTPVVIARLYMGYGPGQAPDKLIPYVIHSLLEGRAPILSSGEQEYDWVYVDDLIEGLLLASRAVGVEGSTIEFGSGRLTSVRRVVELLTTLLGTDLRPRFGALPERPPVAPRVAPAAAVLERLGWRASVPLETGLARTVEWHRSHSVAPGPA